MDTREHTKKLANDIRTKIYGKEVREALATGIEESGDTSQEARDITENLLDGSYDTGLLNTEIEQRMNNLYSTKGQAMDELYMEKDTALTNLYTTEKAELDNLQADYADRAETLETTYAPRLTSAEQDITTNHQEVTAQLDQTTERMDGLAINPLFPPVPFNRAIANANYYDEVNKKYYSDESMTTPATNNQAVFQGLVNYLHDNGGGTLVVPKGTFLMRSGVKWRSGVSMVGVGSNATKFVVEGEIFDLFYNLDGPGNGTGTDEDFLKDVTFEGFQCDLIGLTKEEPSVNGKAFFILYMKRARFHNLLLRNTIGTALGCDFLTETVISNVVVYRAGRNTPKGSGFAGNSGIGVGTCALEEETLVVSNCHTFDCGNYGVFVETQSGTPIKSKYAKVIGCHAYGNRLGFGNKGSGGVQFIGCTAINNDRHGFHLTQGSEEDLIVGCKSEYNGERGISIESDYVGDLMISSTKTNYNGKEGIGAVRNINTNGFKNVSLSDIETQGNGAFGVWFGGNGKNLSLNNIRSFNNGQTSVALYSRGIAITGANDIVSILGCTAFDDQETKTQPVGIEVSSETTNYIVDGNNAVGYTQANGIVVNSKNGVIGKNGGLIKEASGTHSFADGLERTWINHQLNSTDIKTLSLIPKGNAKVWFEEVEPNRIRIYRDSTSGVLEVYWSITVS